MGEGESERKGWESERVRGRGGRWGARGREGGEVRGRDGRMESEGEGGWGSEREGWKDGE